MGYKERSTIPHSTDDGENCQKLEDNLTLIWLDGNLNRDNDNLQSMTELCQIIHSIRTFTQINSCLFYLTNQIEKEEKIILLISGSFGEKFVPLIHSFSCIDSIYIFCFNKNKHEQWATQWNKVKGVFTRIQNVCRRLKQNYSPRDRKLSKKTKPLNFIEQLIDIDDRCQETKNEFLFHYTEDHASSQCCSDDQQQQEDVQKAINPFPMDCLVNSTDENQIVQKSQSVIPYINESERDSLPTDAWPNLLWIDNSMLMRNRFDEIRNLVLRADRVTNLDLCLEHVADHRNQIYFIVLCHSDDLQHSLPSICRQEQVRRVYLHCSLQSLQQYQSLINRYSSIVSIFQHSKTLTHMILWDMSVYAIQLGEHYEKDRQNYLAKERYRYAVLLQTNIERNLQKNS